MPAKCALDDTAVRCAVTEVPVVIVCDERGRIRHRQIRRPLHDADEDLFRSGDALRGAELRDQLLAQIPQGTADDETGGVWNQGEVSRIAALCADRVELANGVIIEVEAAADARVVRDMSG